VVAVEPSQYWEITREDLEDFLNNYNAAGIMLMIGLATTLSQRIRGITAKLAEQADINKFRDMTVDFE
jgi:CRP-like cAMP-binding protein